jgi:colanic acid biosynthesis glycosyl transferase WcaI
LDAQAIILTECHRHRIKFIFWVQDFIGIATERILKAKSYLLGLIIGEHYKRLERKLLRNSNNIVIISPDFQPLLLNWGINHHKINIIPNWAPLEIISDRPKGNSWAEQMGVADKFCFLYSGTLGMKHNPELLLRLALFFKESLDTCVVVISEGPGANWLIEQREIHKLDNLLVLPFQPMEQYADVLASGDVLVTILEPDAGIFSVPSKVLSYLCAKRPQLLAVPEENLAAKIVLNNEAGIVVNPLHKTAFLEAAKILYGHPSKRLFFAENGYLYAKNNFNIEKIGDSFERIILEAH